MNTHRVLFHLLKLNIIFEGNNFLYLKGLNTFGSGEWYAFAYNNDDWELKKFDSEDDALSLCSFKSNYIWIFLEQIHA